MTMDKYTYFEKLSKEYPNQLENMANGFYIDENGNKVHIGETTIRIAKDKIKHPWNYE